MADDITLTAVPGRTTGSAASRRLRASGKIPAVLYGRGAEPAVLTVDWRELRAALTTDKGLNALLTLRVDGKATKAIVKEMQRHPTRRDVLHIDFLAVDVDKPIATDVPIVLEGEATLVLREQGVVDQVLNALVVHAKPDAIPGHLSVDISELEVGHTITVGDLQLPPGVTTDVDPEETVVTAQVTSLALAEEAEAEEGEEAEEGAEAAAEGEGAGAEAAEGGAEGQSGSGSGESGE
jgi:large subunit ribosomal protein L25